MPDSLRFELIAPAEAHRATAVPITLRLTNVADHPVEAHFLGRDIAIDVVVRDEQNAVVWRRLEGRAVPSILQIRMLEPGETLEWKEAWRPTRNGRYRLQGVLPSDAPEPLLTPNVDVWVR